MLANRYDKDKLESIRVLAQKHKFANADDMVGHARKLFLFPQVRCAQ